MTDHNNLEERLRALGSQPVDSGLQSEHLTQMSYVKPATTLAHKARVAGALVAGIFIGSTGLAFAGALPEQAQNVAHEAFEAVGVDVPPGHARAAEARAKAQGEGASANSVDRNTADCPDQEEFANHGAYVRSVAKSLRDRNDLTEEQKGELVKEAAESDCGKPLNAGTDDLEIENEPNDAAEEGQARKGQGQANRPEGAGTQGSDAAAENRPPQSFEHEDDTELNTTDEDAGPPSDVPPEDAGESGEHTD